MPPAILIGNSIDGNATLSSGTANSAHPLTNLYDAIAGKVFKWTVTTGGYVQVSYASPVSIDTIMLANHNWAATATITITGDNSDPPVTVLATPAWRQYDIWADLGSQTLQYLRVTVADSNTVASGFGQLIPGTRTALPRSFRYGKVVGRNRADIFHETQQGAVWDYLLFQREARDYKFRVAGESTELATMLGIDALVQGRAFPFGWIPDTAAAECYYARFYKEPSFRPVELVEGDFYDFDWPIESEVRGVDLLS